LAVRPLAAGIVELQAKANDFMPKMSKFIGGAKEEIWFTGISFYWTLPQNKEEILRKLDQEIPVKFIIYNHLSDNVNEVASGFEQKKEDIIQECAMTIQTWTLLKTGQAMGFLIPSQ
jgi:hypothetical protein